MPICKLPLATVRVFALNAINADGVVYTVTLQGNEFAEYSNGFFARRYMTYGLFVKLGISNEYWVIPEINIGVVFVSV
jgi:hypothetical protein